jgi:hypothetical protein
MGTHRPNSPQRTTEREVAELAGRARGRPRPADVVNAPADRYALSRKKV